MNFFLRLLSENPSEKISLVKELSHYEKEEIFGKFRFKGSSYPRDESIIDIFEEIVKNNPHKVALTDSHISLTYSELNNIANYLSRYLLSLGLGSNKYAAICEDNQIDTIICMIAILKAGAAYIPIDSNYTESHIMDILQDCNPSLFLTNRYISLRLRKACCELTVKLVLVDYHFSKYNEIEIPNSKIKYTPLSLAYVIYTSGTTGKPKGVMVNNRSVVRLVKNSQYIKISKKNSIAQAASISFDAATFEIWGALLNGCKLVVISNDILLNINKLSHILDKENVDILWLTSSLFNQISSIKPGIFRNLKYLLVGGDTLNTERIFSVFDYIGGRPNYIINGYGPTENNNFYHYIYDYR